MPSIWVVVASITPSFYGKGHNLFLVYVKLVINLIIILLTLRWFQYLETYFSRPTWFILGPFVESSTCFIFISNSYPSICSSTSSNKCNSTFTSFYCISTNSIGIWYPSGFTYPTFTRDLIVSTSWPRYSSNSSRTDCV